VGEECAAMPRREGKHRCRCNRCQRLCLQHLLHRREDPRNKRSRSIGDSSPATGIAICLPASSVSFPRSICELAQSEVRLTRRRNSVEYFAQPRSIASPHEISEAKNRGAIELAVERLRVSAEVLELAQKPREDFIA